MSGRQKEGNGAVEGSLVSKTEICYIHGNEFLIRSSLNNEYRDDTDTTDYWQLHDKRRD